MRRRPKCFGNAPALRSGRREPSINIDAGEDFDWRTAGTVARDAARRDLRRFAVAAGLLLRR
jgi:hypothetical protein